MSSTVEAPSPHAANELASTATGRALRLGALLSPYAAAIAFDFTLCPVALFARAPCPGCGMTRAAFALAEGDLGRATSFNPLALAVVPTAALLFAYSTYHYVRHGRTRLGEPWPTRIGVSASVGLLVVWALRWLGYFGGPVPV